MPYPKGLRKLSLIDRVLRRLSPEPNTGCWLWTGALTDVCYGAVRETLLDGTAKNHYVHRLVYEHFHGPLNGLDALHRCDVPWCASPYHLFAGTQQDNTDDMVKKGRGQGWPKGVPMRPYQAQIPHLTDEQRRALRETWFRTLAPAFRSRSRRRLTAR